MYGLKQYFGYITATMKICEERNISWEDYWKESENLKINLKGPK